MKEAILFANVITAEATYESLDVGGKLEDYCKVIRQLEADLTMFKAESNIFADKAKRAENGVKRMKESILNYMLQTDKTKADAGLFKIATRDSKAVNITDEKALPAEYLVAQQPKVDKKGIREALLEGKVIPGAEIQINKSVTIK